MTQRKRYGILWYSEFIRQSSPSVPCPVRGEAGVQLMQATVHASGEVPVVLHVFAPREQETSATIAVNDFHSFWRHEDRVETFGLAAVVFNAARVNAVGGKSEQVAEIYAEQTE